MADVARLTKQAIEERIEDNWSETAIAWPGIDFDPGNSAWIRPTVLFGETEWGTMGTGGRNAVSGILTVQFFDRPGTGLGVLFGYADAFRRLFNRASIQPLLLFSFAAGGNVSGEFHRGSTGTHNDNPSGTTFNDMMPDVIEFDPAGAPRQALQRADKPAWEMVIMDCPFTVEEYGV